MSTQAQATSVRSEIVVAAPIERAFAVFTEQFDRISRASTTCSRSTSPRRCSSRGLAAASTTAASTAANAGGRECWPTSRPSAWCSVGTSVRRGRSRPTRAGAGEVEVRFVVESPERTRVELGHRHIDRHGDGWEGVREGVQADQGWPLYLQRYGDLLKS